MHFSVKYVIHKPATADEMEENASPIYRIVIYNTFETQELHA
jgi:hypothetical protein